MTASYLAGRKQLVERRIRARELVFGIQDGLISTVGLLSGMSAANQSRVTVVLTGVAAAVTGGLSMATGSYLSARTEKESFEMELLDQERPAAYHIVQEMSRHRDLLLRTVQEKVLGLGSAAISNPLAACLVMFLSFLIGAVVPVVPYLVAPLTVAVPISWIASALVLVGVGVFKGALTGKPLVRSGMGFAAVAVGSAVVG